MAMVTGSGGTTVEVDGSFTVRVSDATAYAADRNVQFATQLSLGSICGLDFSYVTVSMTVVSGRRLQARRAADSSTVDVGYTIASPAGDLSSVLRQLAELTPAALTDKLRSVLASIPGAAVYQLEVLALTLPVVRAPLAAAGPEQTPQSASSSAALAGGLAAAVGVFALLGALVAWRKQMLRCPKRGAAQKEEGNPLREEKGADSRDQMEVLEVHVENPSVVEPNPVQATAEVAPQALCVLCSAGFAGESEELVRQVARELAKRQELEVLTGAGGDDAGPNSVQHLHKMQAMVAFATDDYCQKTDSPYCASKELKYAYDNGIPIKPVQLYDGEWPPAAKSDEAGLDKMVLSKSMRPINGVGKAADVLAAEIYENLMKGWSLGIVGI